MIVLGLRTADQGRVTANSHARSASFHPDLRHFKLGAQVSSLVVEILQLFVIELLSKGDIYHVSKKWPYMISRLIK